MQKLFCVASAALLGLSLTAACAASSDLEKVMKERGLSEKMSLQLLRLTSQAVKKMISSSFHLAGRVVNVLVYGVPSMRIYKYIGVFTPEPWQGYGYDNESKAVLKQGNIRGKRE